jgi:hypothetical protein
MNDFDYTRDFDFTRIAVERAKVACPVRADFVMRSLTVVDAMDPYLKSIEGYVLRHEVGRKSVPHVVTATVDFEEWESWWQHTKAVHFPTLSRWMRRPPRQRIVTKTERRKVVIDITSYNTFPDARIEYPRELSGPYEIIIPKQVIATAEYPA